MKQFKINTSCCGYCGSNDVIIYVNKTRQLKKNIVYKCRCKKCKRKFYRMTITVQF